MNILLIADPHIPVPPTHYGGAERIVHLYAQEFARLGHRVGLMAGSGSHDYGAGLYVHRAPTKAYPSRVRRKLQFQLQSLWAARDADVVFDFGRFDYLEALLSSGKPILYCFQNPVDQMQIDFAESRAHSNFAFHCISENQRSHAKISRPVHVIPNPVDTSAYRQGSGEEGYLVFLGRLTSNKGVDTAINVALRTGKHLVVAGNQANEDGATEYFLKAIKPHLDGEQISWIGPVNNFQKQELLSGASALLFPIRWDEPFGIVMVEALACGTPVIALRRGSTPEVIRHEETGFLCDNEDDLVEAVQSLASIDRTKCRYDAETRFDVRILAPKVLEVLHTLTRKDLP